MQKQVFTIENSIQYLQEKKYNWNYIEIDANDLNKNSYNYPVNTIFCNHIKIAYNLDFVLGKINSQGQYVCQECKKIAHHPNELQKDIRWNLKEEFNLLYDKLLVIHSHMFHCFQRNKKYRDAIINNTVLDYISLQMQDQNYPTIYQILGNANISNRQQQNVIIFKTICLLDFVQLNFPVRFKACLHPECYELSSLLVYQKEYSRDLSEIQELKQFVCKQKFCNTKVDISTEDKIFQNVYIDKELLKLIKKGLPSIYTYKYNTITKQIQQDCLFQNGVIVDPYIFSLFQNFKSDYSFFNVEYEIYQKEVTQHAYFLMQTVLDDKIQQKLKLCKYKNFSLNPLVKEIEQPARCKNCDISQTMELKKIISHFYLQKIQAKQLKKNKIACPLCKNEYSVSQVVSSLVYFDQNLFNALEKGFLILQDQTFRYNGKQLMIEEFQRKQKLGQEDFKQDLKEKNNKLIYTFKQLFCSSNPQTPILLPLILKKCPQQKIVEFETFYQRIEQLELQDYEQQCLKFCSCEYCSNNPFSFQNFPQHVYFHEAFYKALINFRNSNKNQNVQYFTYDFEFNTVIQEVPIQKKIIIKESLFKQGFISLLDDQQYQQLFKQQMVNNQFYFKIEKNELSTPFGTLINNQQGYYGNADKQLNQWNQLIQQKQPKNEWGFQIIKTETKIQPNFLQIAKGNISSDMK